MFLNPDVAPWVSKRNRYLTTGNWFSCKYRYSSFKQWMDLFSGSMQLMDLLPERMPFFDCCIALSTLS